jgi:hypothetical protein
MIVIRIYAKKAEKKKSRLNPVDILEINIDYGGPLSVCRQLNVS